MGPIAEDDLVAGGVGYAHPDYASALAVGGDLGHDGPA